MLFLSPENIEDRFVEVQDENRRLTVLVAKLMKVNSSSPRRVQYSNVDLGPPLAKYGGRASA